MNDTNKTTLVVQNRFLNSEVIRLNERCQTADKKLMEFNRKLTSLEMEMQEFKREYVYLLQSCIRIPVNEHANGDIVQVKLFGGNLHERRVRKLLDMARVQDPTLPTFESVCNPQSFHVDEYGFRYAFEESFHVDEYGFRYAFEEVPLALHYICTQLHNHYQSQLESHQDHKRRWKLVLDECDSKINNTNETRSLCRAGIPRSMRSTIWRILIHQQVSDLKAKFGKYYYRNLCSSQGTPADRH
uniref:Rab-GAP TBC domain-containing protein n=1 Tax=Steinernema glaseri TaxID=37863 RepID=A0A1I7ZC84_9BILA